MVAAVYSQVPPVRFTVTHGKTLYELEISPQSTILELKQELEQRTQIPAAMQKLMYKGTPSFLHFSLLIAKRRYYTITSGYIYLSIGTNTSSLSY